MLVFSTHAFTEGDFLVGVFTGDWKFSTHAFTEGDVPVPRLSVILDDNSQLTPSRKATANSNNFCC